MEKMEEGLQKKMFAALSEQGREFAFALPPRNRLEALAQRLGIMPKERRIVAGPLTLGARAAAAARLNRASLDRYAAESVHRAALLFAGREMPQVVAALAALLWNRPGEPPKWLSRALWGLDQRGLDEVVSHARGSLRTEAFLDSIISLTGMSLQPAETIAPDGEEPPARTP